MSELYFHADDYGFGGNSDKDIIALCKAGKLDSISIMPNMATFEKSAEAYKEAKADFPKNVRVSIHLNFMEGKCLAPIHEVKELVDEEGFFTCSWGKFLKWSYNPFLRKKIKSQITSEIIAQTEAAIRSGMVNPERLRFDSHQHPHMIPIVFDALVDAIKIQGYKAEFIRNAQDPTSLYLGKFSLYKTYSPVNMLKCVILNSYSIRVRRILKKMDLPIYYLCGVFFSGCMDYERLEKILPEFRIKSRNTNRAVEVLFHPGLMLEEEMTGEFTKAGFTEFHLDAGRRIENDAVRRLGGL